MNIWIVGGGSIGLLFAAKLHTAGEKVLVITRTKEQASAIGNSGITLINAIPHHTDVRQDSKYPVTADEGNVQHNQHCQHDQNNHHDQYVQHNQQTNLRHAVDITVPVNDIIEQYGKPDWVWLAIKQTALDGRMLQLVQEIIKSVPQARVLTLMNGIGHLERLSEHVPEDQLYGAVVSEGAKRSSPTKVEHTGSGVTRVGSAVISHGHIGERTVQNRDVCQISEKNLKQLQKVLQYAGFQTVLSNSLINDIWYKLIINSVINPLTALLGIRNGELLQHAGLTVVMRQLFEEACAVAFHSGVHISDQEALWTMLVDVCSRTARNRSSMLQDLEAGKSTELMWINGAIVRTARDAGIHVPTHETIVHLLQAKEEIR